MEKNLLPLSSETPEFLSNLTAKALSLESSVNGNMLHPQVTELAREIAKSLQTFPLQELECFYQLKLKEYREPASKSNPIPYSLLAGIKFAVNRAKIQQITEPGLIVVNIPYFKEVHRAFPPSSAHPVGEDAPIQKLKDVLFLIESSKLSADVVYMNDSISEKAESSNLDENTPYIYRFRLLEYLAARKEEFPCVRVLSAGNETAFAPDVLTDSKRLTEISEIRLHEGRLRFVFTSLEEHVSNSKDPSARVRFEERSKAGKILERKGGAVVAALERGLDSFRLGYKLERVVNVSSDADRAFPEAAWLGDAAHAILQQGKIAYLADLKSKDTLSIVTATEEVEDLLTKTKVLRRKQFLSGFLIPIFFPELNSVHNYTGTTQLPAKAFSGTVDFAQRRLGTMRTNVDLGLITTGLAFAAQQGKKFGFGPLISIENTASSTMTMADLTAEWEKTYGPIFVTVPDLLLNEKGQKEYGWLVEFLRGMSLKEYEKLFTDLKDENVKEVFGLIQMNAGKPYSQETVEKIKNLLKVILGK